MIIKPKKIGRYYIYENKEAGEDAINVGIISSVHGDEVHASIITYKLISYLKFNHFYNNVRALIVYPFVNRPGIRDRNRNQVTFCSNLNDDWLCYDYRASIKNLIDTLCNDGKSKAVIIDVHNSPWMEPCCLLEQTDINCNKIEFVMQQFNQHTGINYTVNIAKRHTDSETIKSYVNSKYNENAFGITLEIGAMSQILINNNFTVRCADKIDHFIRFISDNFNKYTENLPNDFKSSQLSYTLTTNSSGILQYTAEFEELNQGDTIAKIIDIESFKCIDEIKAPFNGKLVSKINELYVNITECIGLFIPVDIIP